MKTMRSLIFMIFILETLSTVAFGLAKRSLSEGTYSFVGYGSIRDRSPHCTYTIVRHGLLLTAKHCFKHRAAEGNPVLQNELSVTFPGLHKIEAADIQEIILDQGDNDIAWVTYNSKATLNLIDLPEIVLSDRLPLATSQLEMPGSPASRGVSRPFIDVKDCTLTGFQGRFPPKPQDLGYEGLLIEMDCPAWYGQSGSPVITRVAETSFVLYGVLAHTFKVGEDGSVDTNSIERDSIGNFVRLSMFSPIFLNEYLR